MIKTKKTTTTSMTTSSELDFLSDVSASKETKDKIKQEVGDFLIEQTLSYISDSRSPIAGGKFKKSLSTQYAKNKSKSGRPAKANLEFYGDLLEELDYRPTSDGIEIGYINSSEALKADGHNNLSGKSKLPERRFLPSDNQTYKDSIQREVNKIINDEIIKESGLTRSNLVGIFDDVSFWQTMKSTFVGLKKREIRQALIRNEDYIRLLIDFTYKKLLDSKISKHSHLCLSIFQPASYFKFLDFSLKQICVQT